MNVVLRFIVLWLAAGLTGCGSRRDSTGPSPAQEAAAASVSTRTPKPKFSDFPVPPQPSVTPELLARGKQVYSQNCAACHGERGDGKGLCSADLVPRPRNFITAHFEFHSTPMGHLPTNADLFRIVSIGVNGAPMPPWKWLLSDNDRWAAVEYLKTFSPRFANTNEDRATVVALGSPIPRTDAAIAEGKVLYSKLACISCHGEQGRGNGPSAPGLVDESGLHISPRDFSRPSSFRTGYSAREIVRTVMTGLDGTPMPGFGGSVSKDDAWRVAYYVETLAKPEVTPVDCVPQGFTEGERLGEPDVRIKLLERAWKYFPSEIRVKRGQIVEITFEPTDNGLGAGHGFAVSGYDEVAFLNGAMVGAPKTVKFRADRAGRFTFYCATQCSVGKLHPLMNGTLIVEGAPGQTAALESEHSAD
jgi:mono/diheme cytochrome c family protein/plastocyanin